MVYSLHSNVFFAILASKGKGNVHTTCWRKYSNYFVSENKNINIYGLISSYKHFSIIIRFLLFADGSALRLYRFKKIERKACGKKLSYSSIYNIEDAEESCLRETNCKGVSWDWVGEEFHLCQVGYDYIDGVDYVHDKFRKSIFGLKFLSFIYHQILRQNSHF